MRVCAYAKSLGRPCSDGWSKLVLCQRDNVIRCLKECMPSCPAYRAKAEEVQGVSQVKSAVSGGVSFSGTPSPKSSGCCGKSVQNSMPETVENRSW